ncbi:MAG TPA: isoprenyl transferase [Alphaproteobacteria bacterium]|nr:isoprenyl transferase [Alphaproteobacteria bacterium]
MAADAEPEKTPPRHVAIIMDGNGRWAEARGLPRTIGHREGADAVRRTVEASMELGIQYLTLFGFSSENWKRPPTEISDLMALLVRYLRSEIADIHKHNVRFRVVGERSAFSTEIIRLIEDGEALTRDNNRLNLTVALNYGGRADITTAARRAAEEVAAGRLDPEDITEERFSGWLSTAGMPDPDLIIRTSGEQRISNFLLWQSAYSEFVFVDTLWPDFTKADLVGAMTEFGRRERRYGASRG